MATIWILFAVALVGVWFIKRDMEQHRHAVKRRQQLAAPKPAPERPDPPVFDQDKHFVEEAKAVSERLRKQEDERLKNNQREMKEIRRKISVAETYCEETGLNALVPEVWETVRSWPDYSSIPDKKGPLDVCNVEGEQGHEAGWVKWTSNGVTFRLEFSEDHDYFHDGTRSCTFVLEADGQHVVTLSGHQGPCSEAWRCSLVQALTVGPWLVEFVRFGTELQIKTASASTKFRDDFDRERAARMDLGQ